jgi:hypothetical protein
MELHERRAVVLTALHEAAASGLLPHEIAMSRLQRADAATTVDELDVLLAGLPPADAPVPSGGLPILAEPYPSAPVAPTTADPGSSPGSRIALRARWKTVIHQGAWRVPAYLLVDPGWATVLLDFVAAERDSAVIDILIKESNGWTKLIVPQGWSVNTDELATSWGSLGNHVGGEAPTPDAPRIVVRGSLGYGYCTVRHPKPRDVRRLRTYLAKQGREPKP